MLDKWVSSALCGVRLRYTCQNVPRSSCYISTCCTQKTHSEYYTVTPECDQPRTESRIKIRSRLGKMYALDPEGSFLVDIQILDEDVLKSFGVKHVKLPVLLILACQNFVGVIIRLTSNSHQTSHESLPLAHMCLLNICEMHHRSRRAGLSFLYNMWAFVHLSRNTGQVQNTRKLIYRPLAQEADLGPGTLSKRCLSTNRVRICQPTQETAKRRTTEYTSWKCGSMEQNVLLSARILEALVDSKWAQKFDYSKLISNCSEQLASEISTTSELASWGQQRVWSEASINFRSPSVPLGKLST